MRGLRSLGVTVGSYGTFLSSILMSRLLPPELRPIVSRTLSEGEWNVESMMQIFHRKIEPQERSAGATPSQTKTPLSTNPQPVHPLRSPVHIAVGLTPWTPVKQLEHHKRENRCFVQMDDLQQK